MKEGGVRVKRGKVAESPGKQQHAKFWQFMAYVTNTHTAHSRTHTAVYVNVKIIHVRMA